jgi:hypothetical protein
MDGQKHALHPTKEAKKQTRQQQKQESKPQSKKKKRAPTPMHTCLLNQLIIHSIIHFGVVFLPPVSLFPPYQEVSTIIHPLLFLPQSFWWVFPRWCTQRKKKYRGIKLYVANFFSYILLFLWRD